MMVFTSPQQKQEILFKVGCRMLLQHRQICTPDSTGQRLYIHEGDCVTITVNEVTIGDLEDHHDSLFIAQVEPS